MDARRAGKSRVARLPRATCDGNAQSAPKSAFGLRVEGTVTQLKCYTKNSPVSGWKHAVVSPGFCIPEKACAEQGPFAPVIVPFPPHPPERP